MTTAKEKCFKEAWDKYKDSFDEKMDIEMQKPWGQRADGSWDSNYNSFWHALNSFSSWLRGNGGSTTQMRIPDLTINNGGKTSVLDLKFTRADGTVDTWRTQPGAGNGNLQRDDYNNINNQLNGKNNPHGNDPSLDPNKCGCNKPNGTAVAPVTVTVPQGAYAGQLFVMPGPLAPGVVLPPVTIPAPVMPGLSGGLLGRPLVGVRP